MSEPRDSFAARLFTATLLVFAVWVIVFFAGLAYWNATASPPRFVTDVEIHSGTMRPGYDLFSIAIAAACVIGWRLRHREGLDRSVLPESLGVVIGAVLAVGMVYYATSRLDHILPRPFSGQGWAAKSAGAYAALTLLLLGVATWATRKARSRAADAQIM